MNTNCKNYKRNSSEMVIGGKLIIEDGATIEGLNDKLDKLEKLDKLDDATTDTLLTTVNSLIADLKAKGYMLSE